MSEASSELTASQVEICLPSVALFVCLLIKWVTRKLFKKFANVPTTGYVDQQFFCEEIILEQ